MSAAESAGGSPPHRPGPLLQATKLHPPRLRPGTVRRERLTSLLVAARPSLNLIVAPAGFGKTSLLADWADVDPRPFAWVAIDALDNDPAVLWSYLAAALGRIVDGGRRSQSFEALAREPDPAAAVAAEIDALDEECVLVLDDYHVIENDECHESADAVRRARAAGRPGGDREPVGPAVPGRPPARDRRPRRAPRRPTSSSPRTNRRSCSTTSSRSTSIRRRSRPSTSGPRAGRPACTSRTSRCRRRPTARRSSTRSARRTATSSTT